ncbi:serine/threonine-protein kinase [Novosphingobium sp.]|uniref:serine/threonine-protein kinase n=1 Tax=Novosphingobium sp. TaxID=1874826 RepID=UPI00286DF7CE|nr:serine/threonine-protein kinase [Novosphingobium sp.]
MADRDNWGAVQSLFDELVDLDADARRSRLDRGDLDQAVVADVRSLLAASDAEGVLDTDGAGSLAPEAVAGYSSLSAGTVIGKFAIERLVGRGGMGEVYAARRTDAGFEQRVALKLLRPEAASRIDLFERERRLLAGLEHPGIARLIDGGIAPDGRPYMAMEYVEGLPIDLWCAAQTADLDTRLRLLREICDAVGYAHTRLVIHRDLKPSNILVDDRGRVRLLDFGVARLLDESMTTGAPTQTMVTPDYAAPEQLGNETSTAVTDIYALGAVMYQLLAGRGPWAGGSRSLPSLIRRVLNDDPALPSAVSEGPIPAARLAGDLDAIVMKAMRRSPDERYRSAAELGDDIARHQRLEPVIARDGSRRYMIGRFVRRYRWAVGASAAAVIALMIGAGGIFWQARQTAIERDIALAEARRSESIVRMLTVMFRDTGAKTGEEATVSEMLDQTAGRLAGSLDTSAKSATLIATLFDLYMNLENIAGADSVVRKALARGIGKGDPVATAQLQMRLASSSAATGKINDTGHLLDAAEAVFRTDPDRYRSELVDINTHRAQMLRRAGKADEAIRLLTATLPQANIALAENRRDLLTIYNNVLVYMIEANQLGEMPAVFSQADAVIARERGELTMPGLAIEQLKGMRLLKLGQPARAEKIFTDVVAQRRAAFGRSASLAVDLAQLGRAQIALGKFDEAAKVLGEARPIAAEKLTPAAMPTLIIGLNLAEALAESGKLAEADRVVGEVTPLMAAFPSTSVPMGVLARTRAVVRLKQGRTAEARAALDEARGIFVGAGPSGETYMKGIGALASRIAAMR